MKYVYHPDALAEYTDAALYYEEHLPGLGVDFAAEFDRIIEQVLNNPDRARCIDENVHRFLLRCFPYAILYTIEKDCIFIVAVMHPSREPGYWRHRIS